MVHYRGRHVQKGWQGSVLKVYPRHGVLPVRNICLQIHRLVARNVIIIVPCVGAFVCRETKVSLCACTTRACTFLLFHCPKETLVGDGSECSWIWTADQILVGSKCQYQISSGSNFEVLLSMICVQLCGQGDAPDFETALQSCVQ